MVVTGKNVSFGNFCPRGGGGSPIPKSICQNSDKISTFLVKTKNVPYGLKCKIFFFFQLRGFQKGGEGGVRHLVKIPKKIPFFFGVHNLWIQYSGSVVPLAMF